MSPLNHVLVATDLSTSARNAAERAAQLSQAQQASLDLLYVANPVPFERLKQLLVPDDDLLKRVLDTAGEKIRALAALLFQRHAIAAGVQVAHGAVVAEITRVVQDKGSNLLVCGAKGQSVARRLLLGSTVHKLLNRMPCPLLVVKQAPRDAYRTVLVPVDFSASSLRAIERAKAVAPQAEIVLLHVYEAPFESSMRFAHIDRDTLTHYRNVIRKDAVQQLAALAEAAGLADARQIIVHGDPGWRIAEQEQVLECDLIVVGKQGESAFEELLIGSVTKHVLNECQCDVLVSP
ncbi:universal stress protein [Pseudomonas sp. AFG_SD02_1510_Pfu_092]|uniref:universal stress protein n=1 Tax=Pseudomonas sp. AFG_SD02_1510_Pfu_092 TaxID=2259497 RepID=UPI000DEF2F05|nr:universal stress protein [Pseudomonas sp. AFG_SD02_1510_Pfu_092]RCL28449.1 universal stress protein [Pseudomonas sp. AFG_SD02_1510_Pfu_092]